MYTTKTQLAVLRALRETRSLLNTPDRWTKKAFARDAKGVKVSPGSYNATCWCLAGALSRIARDIPECTSVAETEALEYLEKQIKRKVFSPKTNLWLFNDSAKYEDIINLLDSSIVQLERELKG